MEALKVKYEQNRAEVLKSLDVSKELLEVMTRHGLVDIADCVKYQGIHDVKKRNGSLMKTMVERRTERAYPLFIHSLRQAGQHAVADLLTDIGEETRILTHLQSELEQEVDAISDYIQQEEKRSGTAPAGGGGGGGPDDPHPPPPAPTSDREVWVGVQSTLKRAGAQFQRCRAVIDKLHNDCQELARANGDMVVQIRNCYSRVKRMLKPGQAASQAAGEVPKSTQAMFQSLMEDVEKLMTRKSQAQQEENEGRTKAMRMLRHLRDWIQERSSILDTLHSSTSNPSPRVHRLPLLSSRRGTAASSGGFNHSPLLPGTSNSRRQTPSPPRSQATGSDESGSPLTYFGESGGQGQDQGQGQALQQAEHVRHVEPHAISTVLEGLHLLEQQVRQYVHMEILLTDKFRAELRFRQLRKKSHGYTPRGLAEAQRTLDRLESGSTFSVHPVSPGNAVNGRGPAGDGERFYLSKLKASLDVMCEEYNSCVAYMSRVCNSLVKVRDVDSLLAQTDDHGHKKNKKTDKDKKNRHVAATADATGKEKSGSVFSGLFGRKKGDAKPSDRDSGPSLPTIVTPVPGSRANYDHDAPPDDSLLAQLKLLVANYEMVKQRLNRLEDRYRRDYDHKRRAFETTLREKEDEVAKLQIRLKEVEAEKEKYRGLYDKMKVAYAKKR